MQDWDLAARLANAEADGRLADARERMRGRCLVSLGRAVAAGALPADALAALLRRLDGGEYVEAYTAHRVAGDTATALWNLWIDGRRVELAAWVEGWQHEQH